VLSLKRRIVSAIRPRADIEKICQLSMNVLPSNIYINAVNCVESRTCPVGQVLCQVDQALVQPTISTPRLSVLGRRETEIPEVRAVLSGRVGLLHRRR
jgi:hypothetical protein